VKREPAASALDFERIEALFHGALERAPAERAAFLEAACPDERLRREVLELIAADPGADAPCPALPAEALAGLFGEGLSGGAPGGELPRRLGPYRLLRLVGQGGMGVVFEAERADGAYAGRVAIKMLRPGPATAGLSRRFLAERRTLARLEHPGIARLVDAGADESGAPWLALEYVDGESLDTWCDRQRLPLRARLELFVEVAAAVAHAHEQLIVHRDLKPANILVDGGGRVRLLDFGIAKVLDPEAEEAGLTRTGERAMTPAYASPEQLAGLDVGPRSDVYSLGLVLFELLSGRRPYRGETHSLLGLSRALETEGLDSPGRALRREQPGQPSAAELAARRGTTPRALERALAGDLTRICALALHAEPARRYANAGELCADLRRFLAGEPVRATPDSWAYRARRWAQRRRGEALLLGLLVLLALGSSAEFVRQGLASRRQLREIQQLGDAQELSQLEREAAELWPATPERLDAFDGWLARAEALLARRGLHEQSRAALAAAAPAAAGARRFDDWRLARLDELLQGLARLASPEPHGGGLGDVAARRERAASLRRRSLEEPREAWAEAAQRLAADGRFEGFALRPQLGLVPLGQDPDGGLEAFLVLDTGLAPERDASGRLQPSGDSGLVLLLLPGGTARIGAQAADPSAPRFDPAAELDEAPVASVDLDPFLLSKYELTQGQWLRLTGQNPSERRSGPEFPVDRVHWLAAREVLRRLELELPSEVQWEYAARAGSESVFLRGDRPADLAGQANLADAFARDNGGSPGWTISAEVRDGFTLHAPVGSFAPNAFGLFDMLGNLWEWVDGRYLPYDLPARPGDGRRLPPEPAPSPEDTGIVARGGSYMNAAPLLRVSERYRTSPTNESRSTGIRPGRPAR
jgi:serine/threonine protein kinase/formylglycine-generating enzyme required for sulfatase activity